MKKLGMKELSVALLALGLGLTARAATTADAAEKPEGFAALTSKSGTITSTVSFNSGPANAFANDDSNRLLRNHKTQMNLMYTFPTAQHVNAYGIKTGGGYFNPARGPNEWKIYGSNDYDPATKNDGEATWVELDHRVGETEWGDGEYRYFTFANPEAYTTYKYDLVANNGDGYTQWKYMEYFYVPDTLLVVEGYPKQVGTVSPDFGTIGMPTSAPSLSSYASYMNDEETISSVCTGYKIFRKDGEDWALVSTGTGTTCDMASVPTETTKVQWQYETRVKVTCLTSNEGTVQGADWYDYGSEVSLTAVPLGGCDFVRWAGDVPAGHETDNPLVFSATDPAHLIPLFLPAGESRIVQYVSTDGSDENNGFSPGQAKATVGAAVAFIQQFGEIGGDVRVAGGTYDIRQPIEIVSAVSVTGMTGRPEDVEIHNTANAGWTDQNHRVFHLTHADATLASLTISGGRCEQMAGANVYIENGTVTNCVIRDGYGQNYYGNATGFALEKGRVTHCVIQGCSKATNQSRGIAATIGDGGYVDNCLFVGNRFPPASPDSVVSIGNGGTMVNCTIVDTECRGADSSVVYVGWSGVMKNCAIFGNLSDDGVPCGISVSSDASATLVVANCASDASLSDKAVDCCVMTAADFKNYANGDYRPAVGGALHDAGTVEGLSVPATDLAGRMRVSGNGKIDIGCYEGGSTGIAFIIR